MFIPLLQRSSLLFSSSRWATQFLNQSKRNSEEIWPTGMRNSMKSKKLLLDLLVSVKTSHLPGSGWTATARTRATLKTWVRSPTFRAEASRPASTPTSTRFILGLACPLMKDYEGASDLCFLQEGYLPPIVFARLESPTSKGLCTCFVSSH